MSHLNKPLTAHHDINILLHRLCSDVKTVLKDNFIGMYVHGSLAVGDFNIQRSDIDFLVVTTNELSSEEIKNLEIMHKNFTSSGIKWATKLEGSYISKNEIRKYDPKHSRHPALRVDGSFGIDYHCSDWIIQRYIIRNYGLVVTGPDPKILIDPIQSNDLQSAVLGILNEWWVPQVNNPFRLKDREYQVYAILTMCRCIYTLKHKSVALKLIASRWCKETLDEKWTDLIEQAILWPNGKQLDCIRETLDFIIFTLEYSRQFSI